MPDSRSLPLSFLHRSEGHAAAHESSDNESQKRYDPQEPLSWSVRRKWTVLLTTCLVCFLAGIDATSITSALTEIASRFDINDEHFQFTYFAVTSWSCGAAIVPLVVLPLMEDFGIRKFYLSIYVLFTIFVMAEALAPNFTSLVVLRFITGSCGGVLQNVVDGMAADVWREDMSKRAATLTLFTFCLLGGVSFGPVFGGVIVQYLNWRW